MGSPLLVEENTFLASMFTAVCSDGLKGIWLTLIWCRGATKAGLSEPDMMGSLNICSVGMQNPVSESPETVSHV